METMESPKEKTTHNHSETPHHHDPIIKDYTGVLFIDWRSHALWFSSIVCFVLSHLYWLIPLPGSTFLPPIRTYPNAFLNHLFLSLATALASRSLPLALIQKPFTDGIHPDPVIQYGTTGGYGAILSGVWYGAGLRYTLIASLVTGCILLGNGLESDLQSSLTLYYRPITLPTYTCPIQPNTSAITHSPQDLPDLHPTFPFSFSTLSTTLYPDLSRTHPNRSASHLVPFRLSSIRTYYTCNPACIPTFHDIPDLDQISRTLQDAWGHGQLLSLHHALAQGQTVQADPLDAYFMNPTCPGQFEVGIGYWPYTASRMRWVWLLAFLVLWGVGACLIGFSEGSWASLCRTGRLLAQIVHNSCLFEDQSSGLALDRVAYLNQKTGVMGFIKEHNHGYTVTKEELSLA